eukprot:scaffold223135_cov20-Tisochrysis_lutea.AAC.1
MHTHTYTHTYQGSCHYDQHAAKHPELNYGHEDVGGVITLAVPRYPCQSTQAENKALCRH